MRWLAAARGQAPRGAARLCVCVLLSGGAPAALRAENLLALAGATQSQDDVGNSYAWQLEFQEPLSPRLTGSLSWLNEGHSIGHHRDGAALQLWLPAPRWLDRLEFSVGAGPYVYFDTERDDSTRGYSDVHSAAAMLSAAVALDLHGAWYLNLVVNEIYAPGDFNTATVLLGGGYHFGGREHAVAAADAGDVDARYAREQLQLFAGTMIYNELPSHQDRTLGLEYRLSLLPWLAWSAAWFHGVDDPSAPRDQVATQIWLVDPLRGGSLTIGAGLGLYAPLGTQSGGTAVTLGGSAALSGLSALRIEWNLSRRSSLIVSWYRSFTNDDGDRDIITLGYGFRFGSAL